MTTADVEAAAETQQSELAPALPRRAALTGACCGAVALVLPFAALWAIATFRITWLQRTFAVTGAVGMLALAIAAVALARRSRRREREHGWTPSLGSRLGSACGWLALLAFPPVAYYALLIFLLAGMRC